MPRKKESKSESKLQLQKLDASIDVFEDCIVASKYLANGVVERRYVSSADVAQMFANEGGARVVWFEDLSGVVAAGQSVSGDSIYLVVRPAAKTVIKFEIGKKRHRLTICMPSLLARISRRSGKWSKLDKVFAFKGKLTAQTALYVPPLPNMYSKGSVCMGSVDIKKFAGNAADCFEEVFIKSVFTDHILDTALNAAGHKKYRNIIDAIRKTDGKVNFKYMEKVGTYGEIFKN